MAQTFAGRLADGLANAFADGFSWRTTGALVLGTALLLSPALLATASAQLLGYASNAPMSFPSDNMMVEPADDGDAGTAVVPERLKRAIVAFNTHEAPGTIVIDTGNTQLYYVLGQGRAVRYGVGVGREGFTWSGVQAISKKAEWPDWTPPAEMIARQPYLPRFVAGGPGNPLGARAMYLGSSVYRIHGTNDPSTIGKFVSSGCIRLTNEDVADLFSRVSIGTKVVVLPKNAPHIATRNPATKNLTTRNLATRTTISVRPVAAQPRPAVSAVPGRQAMNVSTSSLY
ncbi:MAG: L,D-transpeptidase [Bradyrhizobium sp.]|nr:L,D-transpeptidase [Bradyrhizobium sp.]